MDTTKMIRRAQLKNYNYLDNTRHCTKCNRSLDLSLFSERIKKLKNGITTIGYRECCKECSLKSLASWGRPSLEHRRDKHKRNLKRDILNSARSRAKKHNMDFNISIEDIIIPKSCPYLNIPLNVCGGGSSPALDRIDNTKGYIKGNIMIISNKANLCKNSLNLNELKTFALSIIRVLNKLDELSEQPEVVNTEPSSILNE